MTARRVSLKELGRELPEFAKATVAKQRQAVILGLQRSIPMLVQRSPVDQGQYAASWDMRVTERKAVIFNFAPHAPVIEFGARPFTPPIGPLLAWAKRVLKDSSQPPNYSSAVWGLARGTQRKIAREGMKPKRVLTDALPDILRNITAELRRIK